MLGGFSIPTNQIPSLSNESSHGCSNLSWLNLVKLSTQGNPRAGDVA